MPFRGPPPAMGRTGDLATQAAALVAVAQLSLRDPPESSAAKVAAACVPPQVTTQCFNRLLRQVANGRLEKVGQLYFLLVRRVGAASSAFR